jgi:hypothetical protein
MAADFPPQKAPAKRRTLLYSRRYQYAAGEAVSVRGRTFASKYSPDRRTTMNVVVIALLSVSIPVAALVLHLAQDSVERWEQRRHADD